MNKIGVDEWVNFFQKTRPTTEIASNKTICPEIESSEFLCDRPADYNIEGTSYCNIHARRRMEQKDKRCGECDEVVRDENGEIDGRVQSGLKCGHCAYGE
jgi:hypothetical protein